MTNGAGATVALSLDDAGTYTSQTVNNQNFNASGGQTRETYVTDYVYDNVDAGVHTVREWGVEGTDANVTAANNRLIVEVLGYTC